MIKKLLIWLIVVFGLHASATFKVLEFKCPDSASVGQTVTCSVKLEVLSETPQTPRPRGGLFCESTGWKVLPANSFKPWTFGKRQVKGAVLPVTFSFVVPDGEKPGTKLRVTFGLWGSDNGKLVYANLVDTAGEKIGLTLRGTIKVVAPEQLKLNAEKSHADLKVLVIKPMQTPEIDGIINPEEWKRATSLDPFVNNMNGGNIFPTTNGFIGRDDKNIYLAFICNEPAMDKITARAYPGRHDAPIWTNDAIEIFFRPNPSSTDCAHFIVDTLNQHFDAFSGDYQGFNPVWESAVKKSASGWSVEIKIPITAVSSQKIKPGTVWQADFFREHDNGKIQSAWQPTNGQCALLNSHGFIVFDSIKAALTQTATFTDDYKKDLNGASSPELLKLLARIDEVKLNIAQWSEAKASENFLKIRAELSSMQESYRQLIFAAKHAASGSPLVIQQAEAFDKRPPERNNAELLNGLRATFLADETRQFAFNVSNISAKQVIFRCTFRYGKKDTDFLRLGLPGFHTKWRTTRGVASADGTIVYDALPENPSGTYKVAPGETIQCFVSIKPKTLLADDNKGFLVIQDIDGGTLETLALPVDLKVIPVKLADAPDKLFSFGWDYLPTAIADERPKFAQAHFTALRENGFNISHIVGIRHLPRPRADRRGNLVGTMDFSKLDNFINQTQGKNDYYFFNVAIWEKGKLRRDLFGLDFYSPPYEKAFKAWLQAIVEHLESKGISREKLIINGYDESLGKEAQMISRWIKEVDPKLVTLIDCSSPDMAEVKRMDKYTDIWMPHFRTLNEDAMQEFYRYLRSTGKPIMIYYYSTGGNEKTKEPHGDYTLKFWTCYNLGLSGIGYWAAGQYYGDPYSRKQIKKTYDTALIYPNESGVCLSRRILAWKRGAQDFKLLKLAEVKLKKQKNAVALKTFQENAQLVTKYPNDLNKAEAMRQFCRELLAR